MAAAPIMRTSSRSGKGLRACAVLKVAILHDVQHIVYIAVLPALDKFLVQPFARIEAFVAGVTLGRQARLWSGNDVALSQARVRAKA